MDQKRLDVRVGDFRNISTVLDRNDPFIIKPFTRLPHHHHFLLCNDCKIVDFRSIVLLESFFNLHEVFGKSFFPADL